MVLRNEYVIGAFDLIEIGIKFLNLTAAVDLTAYEMVASVLIEYGHCAVVQANDRVKLVVGQRALYYLLEIVYWYVRTLICHKDAWKNLSHVLSPLGQGGNCLNTVIKFAKRVQIAKELIVLA